MRRGRPPRSEVGRPAVALSLRPGRVGRRGQAGRCVDDRPAVEYQQPHSVRCGRPRRLAFLVRVRIHLGHRLIVDDRSGWVEPTASVQGATSARGGMLPRLLCSARAFVAVPRNAVDPGTRAGRLRQRSRRPSVNDSGPPRRQRNRQLDSSQLVDLFARFCDGIHPRKPPATARSDRRKRPISSDARLQGGTISEHRSA